MFPLPSFPLCTSLREPTTSAPRGATLGARIDRGISLIMSPSFVCQLRTQTAQSDGTNRQARRSLRSPPCGSNFVFEVAHSVYKYALNKFRIKASPSSIINYSLLIIHYICAMRKIKYCLINCVVI